MDRNASGYVQFFLQFLMKKNKQIESAPNCTCLAQLLTLLMQYIQAIKEDSRQQETAVVCFYCLAVQMELLTYSVNLRHETI
jgi:hypothetical protein